MIKEDYDKCADHYAKRLYKHGYVGSKPILYNLRVRAQSGKYIAGSEVIKEVHIFLNK